MTLLRKHDAALGLFTSGPALWKVTEHSRSSGCTYPAKRMAYKILIFVRHVAMDVGSELHDILECSSFSNVYS